MRSVTGITAVLNVHHEGIVAHASLLSMAAARQAAEAAGIVVEILVVADCSDRATLDYLSGAAGVRLIETAVDDLGCARNVAVAAAQGRFIAFLDGDDLWSRNWLLEAFRMATQGAQATVWHPEASLFFGATQAPYWRIHPDIETAEGDWVTLGMRNHWTSLSFGAREIYQRVPYRSTDLTAGFGYEDWSWNSEVVAQGYLHKPVIGTAHLVRVRDTSLVRRTAGSNALMTPSTLLRSRVGWAARVGAAGVAASPAGAYGSAQADSETT